MVADLLSYFIFAGLPFLFYTWYFCPEGCTIAIPYYSIYYVMKHSDYNTMTGIVIDSSAIWIGRHAGDKTYIWVSGSSAMNAYVTLNDFFNAERKAAGNYMRAKIKTPYYTIKQKLMGDSMGALSLKRRQA